MSSGWVCPGQGMTYPMMHVMLLPPTLCGDTDACENITLPQLRLILQTKLPAQLRVQIR